MNERCKAAAKAGRVRLRRLQAASEGQSAYGRDTLAQLIALTVTPADKQERAQVKDLCEAVQQVMGETVKVAWADQGYTGDDVRKAAQAAGIDV